MLIVDAEVTGAGRVDVRARGDRVQVLARGLAPAPGETVIDAGGAALLPGLHDHHLHLAALAASLASLHCGPPQVDDADSLGRLLQERSQAAGGGWIRGIGYCESVAGEIDRFWLDRFAPSVPVRIQHRSGRLWILNSRALELLAADAGDLAPLEKKAGQWTGRLYDADPWLRERLRAAPPDLGPASALLAGFGVTGVTEVTPHNTRETWSHFAAARARGELRQDLCLMGDASLDSALDDAWLRRGALKIHLHESRLPGLDDLVARIDASHRRDRPVAVHCVTLAELLFALAALEQAGPLRGDRIEHAAVAPPEVMPLLRARGVTVVTQPNFVRERGDRYLRDVEAADRPWLYRARAFIEAGIPLAAGTDAPFGAADPWRAMQAAVDRRTRGGAVLDGAEALDPEQALALFLGPADDPGGAPRRIEVGAAADFCLLDRPWARARRDLAAVRIAATVKSGALIFRREG